MCGLRIIRQEEIVKFLDRTLKRHFVVKTIFS